MCLVPCIFDSLFLLWCAATADAAKIRVQNIVYRSLPGVPGVGLEPVQTGWDNHFAAFGAQDVTQILLDYTESSILNMYDAGTGVNRSFTGLAEIGGAFSTLFSYLGDNSQNGLAVNHLDVAEAPEAMVFLMWEAPNAGLLAVTDTFNFVGNKIAVQNVVAWPTANASAPLLPTDITAGSAMLSTPANGSVNTAISHHYAAFGAGNMTANLEDYTADAEINLYDLRTGLSTSCSGTACVIAAFEPLFALDSSTANFIVNNVDEGNPANGVGGTVLLYFTWGGVATEWTDTFIFDTNGTWWGGWVAPNLALYSLAPKRCV